MLCRSAADKIFKIYIEEHNIAISISIVSINAIESLRKLDIAEFLSELGIHQKAHGFPYSLAIVDVVVTIQIQHERCIGKHCRNSNLLITYTTISKLYELIDIYPNCTTQIDIV